MSEGSEFHSCGAETEKPLRPDRSFRYRGTRSWAWNDDRRLRLAGMSFTEWQSSIKYSGARPARQLLVMEFSLYWIRNWIGSQWRSHRIAAEIGSYLPNLMIKRAAELRTDWRRSVIHGISTEFKFLPDCGIYRICLPVSRFYRIAELYVVRIFGTILNKLLN